MERKILVPALIEDVDIPFEFRRVQAANLVDWNPVFPTPEFEEFLSSVRALFFDLALNDVSNNSVFKEEIVVHTESDSNYVSMDDTDCSIPENGVPTEINNHGSKSIHLRLMAAIIGGLIGYTIGYFVFFTTKSDEPSIFMAIWFGIHSMLSGLICSPMANRYIFTIGVTVTSTLLVLLAGGSPTLVVFIGSGAAILGAVIGSSLDI
jgi:hypothetical protein